MILLVGDENGIITHTQGGSFLPEALKEYQENGQAAVIVQGNWYDGFYIKDGALVARPTLPVSISKAEAKADGKDEIEVSGIPAGAVLTVNDGHTQTQHEVKDGKAELSSPGASEFGLSVQLAPYLPWTGTVSFK